MKESKAMAKKEIAFMKKKGAPKSMIKHEEAEYGMKKGGMAYKKGGIASSLKAHAAAPASKAHGMKKGGSVDGCASKGKTKGKIVKMAYGGKAC